MDLTLEGFDLLQDLYGKLSGVKFFAAGNQWFVLEELVPSMGDVFVETLPPGAIVRQIAGDVVKIGNLSIDVRPDVVSLPPSMMRQVADLVKDPVEYVENEVVVATRFRMKDMCDLAGMRVALPNPEIEV